MLSEDAVIDTKIYRDYEVYSPYSVVKAARSKQLENYWNQTETYEVLMTYIDWNFDGLKEEVAILMEGGRVKVDATWNLDKETVAELLEAAHDKAGNKVYHSEAGLSCAEQLAYYAAQDMYTIIPELDMGKGYADLAFIQVKPDIHAMLVELKHDEDADTAIAKIHRQKYPDRLEHYKGNLIMVGINYDRTVSNESVTFKHRSCEIEKV